MALIPLPSIGLVSLPVCAETSCLQAEPLALFTSDAFAGGWSKVASSDLFFAYGLFGGQIRLQSARSTSRLLLQCDSGAVTDLKFSPSKPTLLASAAGQQVSVWSLEEVHSSGSEQLRETLLVSLDFAEFEGGLQLAWSPTALRLAVFSGTRLKFVDIGKDSSTETETVRLFDRSLLCVSFSENGRWVAAGQDDGSTLILDSLLPLGDAEVARFLSWESRPVHSFAWVGQRTDSLYTVVTGTQHNRFISTGTWNATTLQYTRCQTLDLFPGLRAASAVLFHAPSNSLVITDSLKPLVLQLPLSASKERFLACSFCDVTLPSLFTAPLGGSKARLLCMQMDGLRRVTLPELPKAPLVDCFNTAQSPADHSASPLGTLITSQVDRVMEVMARDKAAQAKGVKALTNVGPLIDAAVQRHLQAALPQLEAAVATSVQRMQVALLVKFSEDLFERMSFILKDALKVGLHETVLPQLEAACREIFRQVNDVLESGVAQSFSGSVTEPLNAALDRLEEISLTFSRGSPRQDVEEGSPDASVQKLLSERRYEEAVAQVLSLRNADVLNWICTHVSRSEFFAAQGLRQNVLLSLIQQLSCDLGRDTVVKATWIRDAMLTLDSTDSMFFDRVLPVIADVHRALEEEMLTCARDALAELQMCSRVALSLSRQQ